MFVHVNWMISCCWYWIHVSKIIYMLYFCEKVMNDEVVFCWTWNEFMINCGWWCLKTCCWWIGMMIMPIGDESCCCCGIIMKFGWIFEFGQNGVWFMSFEHSWICVMYLTYKHYLGRVLSVEGSKLECLEKRVLKFKVFFEHMSVRLSEP